MTRAGSTSVEVDDLALRKFRDGQNAARGPDRQARRVAVIAKLRRAVELRQALEADVMQGRDDFLRVVERQGVRRLEEQVDGWRRSSQDRRNWFQRRRFFQGRILAYQPGGRSRARRAEFARIQDVFHAGQRELLHRLDEVVGVPLRARCVRARWRRRRRCRSGP